MIEYGLPVEGAQLHLKATCSFGMESIVAAELSQLGYEDLAVENGRVGYRGTVADIARCNIWLRVADRVLVELTEFPVETFDDLFDGIRSI